MELEKINSFFNTKDKITLEEIYIIRTILLERTTFYTRKIVELQKLLLKSKESDIVQSINDDIAYYYEFKNSIEKFSNLLKKWG